MIFTGYYAKLDQYKNPGLEPIAISGKRPDFYEGYTIAYKNYLETLDKEEIEKDFESYSVGVSHCVLFRYEKSPVSCHRHVLADWLEENFGWNDLYYLFWLWGQGRVKGEIARVLDVVRVEYDFKWSDYNSPRSFGGSCDPYDVCPFNGYNEIGYKELC